MSKPVFRQLVHEINMYGGVRSSRYMSVTEKVAIFVHIAVTGMAFRHAMQHFQRSSDTISRFFYSVLLIGSFYYLLTTSTTFSYTEHFTSFLMHLYPRDFIGAMSSFPSIELPLRFEMIPVSIRSSKM